MFDHWDATTTAAVEEWHDTLPQELVEKARGHMAEAAACSARRVAVFCGRIPAGPPDGGEGGAASGGDQLIHGPDDDELPDAPKRLQASLMALLATPRLDRLGADFRAAGEFEGFDRLKDLAHPDTDHRWMWAANGACQ